MNGMSVLAFGVATAVIAVASRSPEEKTPPPPYTLRAKGVDVTAVMREVDVAGRKEPHLFLITTGRGSGSVSMRFEVNESLRWSRMTGPYSAWERSITFDQDGGVREADLGALPEKIDFGPDYPGSSRQLLGTTDDNSYVLLWTESPTIDEMLEKAGLVIRRR